MVAFRNYITKLKPFFSPLVFLIFLGINFYEINAQTEMSMGFFTPDFEEGNTLYLYEPYSNIKKTVNDVKPMDSITFIKKGYNLVIDYAPDWFSPVFNKLDYGIFYISVKRLGNEYVEIIANEETRRTTYIQTHTGKYVSWPEFLLNIHSVEFDTEGQKVFDNPMIKSAGRIYDRNTFFRPKFIQGEWMEIEILGENFNPTGNTGWIRWKKDGKLLIRYNLLS